MSDQLPIDGVLQAGTPIENAILRSERIRDRGERQDYARSLTLLPDEGRDLLRMHGADLRP